MQPVIPALLSIGRSVGDILPAVYPADFVALAPHQSNKFLAVMGELHALINSVHESELPTLTFCGGVVLSARHGLALCFLLRLEDGQTELQAHLIVALTQFRQLRLTDMQLLPILEADAVDEKMGVDMVAVHMGTDQHVNANLKL